MPRFFRAENSDEHILVISEGSKYRIYFSPDGKTFQALKTTHFSTVQGQRVLTLQTPNPTAPPVQLTFVNSWLLSLLTEGSDEQLFQYTEKASILNVTLLPLSNTTPTLLTPPEEPKTVLELRHLFRTDDGTYIAVTAYTGQTYSDFKVHVGKLGMQFNEAKVQHATMLRDGGTTELMTAQGLLYWPSSYKANKSPAWRGQNVTRENVDLFDIQTGIASISVFKR